ncbi:MAG: hypothetical protein R2879_14370 [Saprospiraceae bacterium]
MHAISLSNHKSANPTLLFFLFAALFTAFLFFIDEGLYSFKWMAEPGAWFVFFIYTLPIFFAQWAFFKYLKKRISLKIAFIVSSISGLILGTTLVIFLFLLASPFFQG